MGDKSTNFSYNLPNYIESITFFMEFKIGVGGD